MKYMKVALIIIVLLIVLVIVASLIANLLFKNMVKDEVKALYSHVNPDAEIVQKDDLANVPAPVQKWLEYAQVIGKEKM